MKCKSCNTKIPEGRRSLGYTVCVECSDVEKYGCVPIVNHKTGNTIQVMSQDQAEKINKLSARSGFGIIRSLRSGKSANQKTRIENGCSLSYVGSEAAYNKVGEKCMLWVELEQWDKIDQTLTKAKDNLEISNRQYQKLSKLMSQFIPKVEKKVEKVVDEIPDEIADQFRNWRHSSQLRR